MESTVEQSLCSQLSAFVLKNIEGLNKEDTRIVIFNQKHQTKEKKVPSHNSLQHDSPVSAPLLTILVDALKKDASGDAKDRLEIIAEEERKVDPVVALAERIKQMYANEMMHQAYINGQASYNPLAHYSKPSPVKLPVAELSSTEGYEEAKKLEPRAMSDENSIGYKLSKGDKYQAFIMTDPKGRIHSTWEIVRILNETYDGIIERNDGLHGQWLS